jgi:hypothetical protein
LPEFIAFPAIAQLSSSPALGVGLVHLVWAPLGPEPLRAFLRSYETHPAGADHELVILLNGAQEAPQDAPRDRRDADQLDASRAVAPLTRATLAAELSGVAHRLIELERPLLDLAAYGEAARRLEHARLCFLNSYSAILADDWLGHLACACELPDVGLAGATGSWESRAALVHGSALHWAYQLAKLPTKRRAFPRFPNPHIRTTAFMLRRDLALTLGLERARDKDAAYLLESGRRSITRQVQARDLRAVVVGRDGHVYDFAQWPHSRTYRGGEQANLLVADNRTSDWQRAAPELRRKLSRQAWREP